MAAALWFRLKSENCIDADTRERLKASDLSTIKSLVFSLDGSSPVEPDLAAAGTHSWPSTSVIPHSPFSPAGSVLLQDTNPTLEMLAAVSPNPFMSSMMCGEK